MDKINAKITELRKARNLAANRKSKWENTIKELKSLNRNIDVEELKCMDCHSKILHMQLRLKELHMYLMYLPSKCGTILLTRYMKNRVLR